MEQSENCHVARIQHEGWELDFFVISFFLGSLLFAVASASPVTDAQVRSFVASWSQATQLFDEYDEDEFMDEDDDEDDESFSPKSMVSDMLSAMEGDPVYTRVEGIVRQHGLWHSAGSQQRISNTTGLSRSSSMLT